MQEQMYFPEGGVGSFLTSNMDEMPDNVLAFGQPRGINSMGDVANRMAQMGRNGDTELAHLRRDEVVMTEDMARDPRIRNAMAEVFSDNDMDMARYTVGNAANSVNPYTGNREFFLKKIISGVKKIVKMAAPVVIPLAMNAIFPGMGALASGFIGTGISSLAQGNSFKDSMKAGLMGGIMGGFQQGIGNLVRGEKMFTGMLPDASKGGFFKARNPFKPEPRDSIMSSRESTSTPPVTKPAIEGTLPEPPALDSDLIGANIDGSNASILDDPNKFSTKLKNFFYDSGSPRTEGLTLQQAKAQIEQEFGDSLTAAEVAREATRMVGQGAKEAVKGSYKLFPTIGAGLGVAALAGGFDQIPAEEIEDPYDQESPSQKLLAANPEKYRTGVVGAPSYRTLYDVMVPTVRPPIYEPLVEPIQTAARGGEMENFPRKTGYIAGPGTETSDSIPAMLSDGEFVMNAKAVRGAGGGSRERGVRKMYDMMRAFEGGAVA
jgi:hypothetical protein